MPSTNATKESQPSYYQNQAEGYSFSSITAVRRSASIGPSRTAFRPSGFAQGANIHLHKPNDTTDFQRPLTPPELGRRPGPPNRLNSINGVKDGVGNLNRWSQSTVSSRGSTAHKRSSSDSCRMSLEDPGTFASVPKEQSTNRLQRSRAPAGESSTPQISPRKPRKPSVLSTTTFISSPPQSNDSRSPRASATPTSPNTTVPSTVTPDYLGLDPISRNPMNSKLPTRDGPSIKPDNAVSTQKAQLNNITSKHQRQKIETSAEHDRLKQRSQISRGSSGPTYPERSRSRSLKPPSQKAMLSKALQKANTAVLLDNAQNFEGAMQAYAEACDLLQQVTARSSGDEDKRKLEAIRNTYASRIRELEKFTPQTRDDDKALPARPGSTEYGNDGSIPLSDDEGTAVIAKVAVTRTEATSRLHSRDQNKGHIPASQLPQRRESLMASVIDPVSKGLADQHNVQRLFSKSSLRAIAIDESMELAPPVESEYMLAPLSPRRPLSPVVSESHLLDEGQQDVLGPPEGPDSVFLKEGHQRVTSNESISWLDTIDESGDSSPSSVHTRTSSLRLRRRHIRGASGDTEAEFDAALDAAVEAAYDEGFEPVDEPNLTLELKQDFEDCDDEIIANVKRRVELARERVRQTEREMAVQYAYDLERARLTQNEVRQEDINDFYTNESEEEEQMLEEMTRGYVMDDFEFGLRSKSTLPRESDSSGVSGRTYNSSIASNPTTAGTSLSTVAETLMIPQVPPLQSKASHPPPVQSLPQLPITGSSESPGVSTIKSTNSVTAPNVRSRRLSGQNAKVLKIETTAKSTVKSPAPLLIPSSVPPQIPLNSVTPPPQTASQSRQIYTGASERPPVSQPPRQASPSIAGTTLPEVFSPPTPNLDNGTVPQVSGSPGRAQSRSGLRKNFSSSSLKNMKSRNPSISNADDGSDASPITPMSYQFSANSTKDITNRLPALPTLPTPIATAFKERLNGVPAGGLYLFNSDISFPESPGYSGRVNSDTPIPLEPCPNEFLLRPFWLMRALYQTIAHPRGGYLSTKLFISSDVWRVKGVKLKNIEDKISSCDYLTAALQKVAKVNANTCDADAVFEEMQLLEGVLEQVQSTLSKKLGNEVGTQGLGVLFRDAPTAGESDLGPVGSKASSSMSKSSFSWRRLRSKNSGTGLTNTYTTKPINGDESKEFHSMGSLPMTSLGTIKSSKRDISQVKFSGPNANYIGALARLFDAAQVIDQIARQVEDPGLRHADTTQVGLELCTRRAADFFGFYICRFVLADISLLLDKFIKRGSEWVLT